MRVAITGSSGLVGSALVSNLQKRTNVNVIPITRAVCDLERDLETVSYFKSTKPEVLVHCAAKVFGIGGNMNQQYNSWLANSRITLNIIEAAKQSNISHIIFLGTGCVYPSEICEGGYSEMDLWNGPVDESEFGYAQSKRHSLAGLIALKDSFGIDFTYVVSCNLFGPNDSFNEETGHVIPSLISKFERCASGKSDCVKVWGNGSAIRDFLSSYQMASVLSHVIENGPLEIVNVCSGIKRDIRSIVLELCSISGVPSQNILWDSSKPNGQPQRFYKNEKLIRSGCDLENTFNEDLRRTYNWYVANKDSVRR